MSQTTETPQPTNAELVAQVVGAVTAVQDAEAVLVEGAKNLADHIADPNAHGRDVAACIAQAVADHDGNEGAHAGTFVKSDDVRLSDARTPKPHKDSHKTGGADALAPADIGAAPASHTSVAATASVLGHVKLGKVAGTACEGNDARLSNARTPLGHKATHQAGGSDALAPDDIGAAPASHTGVAATASVLGHVKFGTAAGTACQGNDSRLANARTPTAHAATHKHGGTDEIATAAPAANVIPKADANGKLDAWVTPVVDITGNAATADKLKTAISITLSGAVTGTAIFDGSADVNIVTTGTPTWDATQKPSTLLVAGVIEGNPDFGTSSKGTAKLPPGGRYSYSVTAGGKNFSGTNVAGGTVVFFVGGRSGNNAYTTGENSSDVSGGTAALAQQAINESSGTFWRIA